MTWKWKVLNPSYIRNSNVRDCVYRTLCIFKRVIELQRTLCEQYSFLYSSNLIPTFPRYENYFHKLKKTNFIKHCSPNKTYCFQNYLEISNHDKQIVLKVLIDSLLYYIIYEYKKQLLSLIGINISTSWTKKNITSIN